MTEPNFQAYRNYLSRAAPHEGVEVIEGGKAGRRDDYIIVDYDRFRNADPKQTERLTNIFTEAASDGRMEGVYSNRKELRNGFADSVKLAQGGVLLETAGGGGVAMIDWDIVLTDSKTISFSDMSQRVFGTQTSLTTQREEELHDKFTREHEVAHQILGLKEAGADYVAALRLRQTDPAAETDAYLQKLADVRTIRPFRVRDEIAEKVASNSGYGSPTGIEAAIYTPSGELASITPEEMHENALTYDELNQFRGETRPETVIRKELSAENPNVTKGTYASAKLNETAVSLRDKEVFKSGSTEETVLDELIQATTRVDQLMAKTPQPSSQPSVSPSSTPAFAAPAI